MSVVSVAPVVGLEGWPVAEQEPALRHGTPVQVDIVVVGQHVVLQVTSPLSLEVAQLAFMHLRFLVENHVLSFDSFCLFGGDFLSF